MTMLALSPSPIDSLSGPWPQLAWSECVSSPSWQEAERTPLDLSTGEDRVCVYAEPCPRGSTHQTHCTVQPCRRSQTPSTARCAPPQSKVHTLCSCFCRGEQLGTQMVTQHCKYQGHTQMCTHIHTEHMATTSAMPASSIGMGGGGTSDPPCLPQHGASLSGQGVKACSQVTQLRAGSSRRSRLLLKGQRCPPSPG